MGERIRSGLKELWLSEDGQDLVEYALILAFIALVSIAVLGKVEKDTGKIWKTANTILKSVATKKAGS